MAQINRDTLLIGLTYLEAVVTGDDEARKLVSETVSSAELIHAMTAVAMVMTGVATRESLTGETYVGTIEKARKLALRTQT